MTFKKNTNDKKDNKLTKTFTMKNRRNKTNNNKKKLAHLGS